jgi:hypothetical protein
MQVVSSGDEVGFRPRRTAAQYSDYAEDAIEVA